MAQDFLTTYKYGWKTSYYQNTYDNKTDEIKEDEKVNNLDNLINELLTSEEEDCESCKI
jgi:ribonucleoside-diphosphate reductase alpha chain